MRFDRQRFMRWKATRQRASTVAVAVALSGLVLAACGSVTTGTNTSATAGTNASTSTSTKASSTGSTRTGAAATGSGGTVTLITHDSFAMDKSVIAAFEKKSGITLKILARGDAGAMTNQLVLTKDKPLGDVVYGIDNTFASRALDAGVLAPYPSPAAKNGAEKFAVDPQNRLTAVDYGDVCVNVDHTWFKNKKLAEPKSYEDLAKPAYKNLLDVESAATSSPGLAFLLGTIAHFGDSADSSAGWRAYWTSLKANGVKVTASWEDAYSVDFSGSSGKGARPLVVSYASSPPDEVKKGMTTAPTGALLDTCFRQVEYTGVLAGAANPQGAEKVVDFLLSKQFQQAMPGEMYVYPVDRSVALPPNWKQFAPVAPHPATMDPAKIAAGREQWISAWTDLLAG